PPQCIAEPCDVDISALAPARADGHSHKSLLRTSLTASGRSRCRCWRRRVCGLSLLGQQSKLVYACGAHVVHYLDYRAKFSARISPHKHAFVSSRGDAMPNPTGSPFDPRAVVAAQILRYARL